MESKEYWEKLLSKKRCRESNSDNIREQEPSKDKRNPFESDFGRVIFSAACRRLHDKTQVFPLTTDDNIHSRLTHSLEVMNIGLSFAIDLSENEKFKNETGLPSIDILRNLGALLKTACLVHDIGNPPFGHFGEQSIRHYFRNLFKLLEQETIHQNYNHIIIRNILNFKEDLLQSDIDKAIQPLKLLLDKRNNMLYDYIEFDGNAQGFRILTKLQFLNDLYGLNLTSASLASTLKYPNIGKEDSSEKEPISLHKHGVFTTEKKLLDEVLVNCGLNDKTPKRHPLAFLMEAADSICYLVMDIEDAINKGWITLNKVFEDLSKDPEINKSTITDLYEKINKYSGKDAPNRKKIVDFRTVMISYLTNLAIDNFIKNLDNINNGGYNMELIEEDDNNIAKGLKKLCSNEILCKREIQTLEITGDSIISGIIDSYINLLFNENKKFRQHGKSLISKAIFLTTLQEHIEVSGGQEKAKDVYEEFDVKDFSIEERLRIIRDYVSGMTDKFALNHYRRLSGQQIY